MAVRPRFFPTATEGIPSTGSSRYQIPRKAGSTGTIYQVSGELVLSLSLTGTALRSRQVAAAMLLSAGVSGAPVRARLATGVLGLFSALTGTAGAVKQANAVLGLRSDPFGLAFRIQQVSGNLLLRVVIHADVYRQLEPLILRLSAVDPYSIECSEGYMTYSVDTSEAEPYSIVREEGRLYDTIVEGIDAYSLLMSELDVYEVITSEVEEDDMNLVGNTKQLRATFKVDGVDTDPTSITLTIYKPSGVQVTATWAGTIVKTATGKFKYDLVQDEAGHWKAKWVGTGTVPHHDFWEWDVSNDPT